MHFIFSERKVLKDKNNVLPVSTLPPGVPAGAGAGSDAELPLIPRAGHPQEGRQEVQLHHHEASQPGLQVGREVPR